MFLRIGLVLRLVSLFGGSIFGMFPFSDRSVFASMCPCRGMMRRSKSSRIGLVGLCVDLGLRVVSLYGGGVFRIFLSPHRCVYESIRPCRGMVCRSKSTEVHCLLSI